MIIARIVKLGMIKSENLSFKKEVLLSVETERITFLRENINFRWTNFALTLSFAWSVAELLKNGASIFEVNCFNIFSLHHKFRLLKQLFQGG